jgi:hypothetical protein
VTNWLDSAGHSNGAILLRCVRTESAPVPKTRVVRYDDIRSSLPADTSMTPPDRRAEVIAARRRAVHERFHQ